MLVFSLNFFFGLFCIGRVNDNFYSFTFANTSIHILIREKEREIEEDMSPMRQCK